LQTELAELRVRNRVLEKSLAEANRAEREASRQLAEVRNRLEALGGDLLDQGDDRLVQAAADLEVLNRRVEKLEAGALKFSRAVADFLASAIATEPESRMQVESAMRELDSLVGLRHKPAPAAPTSTSSRRGKVVSIDSESGLLVLNIGEQQGVRIGTTYQLMRGDEAYGSAIIADVRDRIAGAFVESLQPGQGPVHLGDLALLHVESF
jgi:chromosome segregation ATPase